MRIRKPSNGIKTIKNIGIFSWSVIGFLLIAALFFYIIYLIKIAIIPLILAIAIAYLLTPIVILLQKKMRRVFAVTITYIIFTGIIFTIFFFIIPIIIDQFRTFMDKFPAYMENLTRIINDFLQNSVLIKNTENLIGKEIIPRDASGIIQYFISSINLEEIDIFRRATTVGMLVFNTALYLIVGPLLGIYILNYTDKIKTTFIKIIPKRFKNQTTIILERINKVAGRYVRGQILVSIIVGILCTIVLLVLKVDFAILLGSIAGLLNMIPLLGPIIGAIPAALTALFISPLKALLVILLFIAVQQIDNYIISPNIMKYQVGVHPGIIIFSLMAGGALFGIWGLLIAVPTVAILQEILRYYLLEKNKIAS
ncbi:MAG: AI-2E family transporter [Actinobacteria bacterium]|nr:AI-2E family transporter [Actinomycetota bacterium]MBU4483052.1 AI-2E family transporter [Actinomycetota bacterium]MCG2791846.1 AI-2E family transporter [Actinomycetes bacterium]